MIELDGVDLPSLPISGLKHVRDLVYFDGPLLSQYAHSNGDDYLHYWCDCDNDANRWMVLRVSEASVLRLVNRLVPLDYVIPKECKDDFVYFFDQGPDGEIKEVKLVAASKIPEEYVPEPGAYLEGIEPRRDERSYSVLVEGGWSVRALGDFPKLFAKVYSILYVLNVLRLSRLEDYPWRGGFSYMHFFNWTAEQIPSEDRPRVSAMQYASPGFMRFSLHGQTANQVTRCVVEYKNDNELAVAYQELSHYIRNHKLNDIQSSDDPKWLEHGDYLKRSVLTLLKGFSVIDAGAFLRTSTRPFETAKIAMAIYRYVKELAEFDKDGLVKFPKFSTDDQPRPAKSSDETNR